MKHKLLLALSFFLILALTACTATSGTVVTNSSASTTSTAATQPTSVSTAPASAAVALAEKTEVQTTVPSTTWESASSVSITFNGATASSSSDAAQVNGSLVTITRAGTYVITGASNDGQVIVNTEDDGVITLVLQGLTLASASSAPLYIQKAKDVQVILADGSQNTLADAVSYTYPSADISEPNAAIFSNADLTFQGNGTLSVTGNYQDGITSEDSLTIASGSIQVTASDDGIRGKDHLLIQSGTITVTAQGDGLKSDNEEDAARGYIAIEAGTLNITSGGDAIHAQTDIIIQDGTFNITAGGGSQASLDETISTKGLKATANINIDAGTFTINASDDALHTNGNLVINGGTFSLSSGDDGMHADTSLTINNGTIQVLESYEGIESTVITIQDGQVSLNSSDDGINVASGVDGSGMMPGGRPGGRGRPGQDNFTATGNNFLYINGGSIYVDARGDGVDVNGSIAMSGGTLIVNGPVENMNGALDYDGSFSITGGYLLAAGSAGMAMAPDTSSTQPSLLLNLSSMQAAGELIHIQNSSGQDILTFAPARQYQSITFSSPDLVQGESYTIYLGGTASGSPQDGLYPAGGYSAGTQYTQLTLSGIVTGSGSRGGRP